MFERGAIPKQSKGREQDCSHCEGCGMINNRICKQCNGHGIVFIMEDNGFHSVNTYAPTQEQLVAMRTLGGVS
jgi:DnaJ-class molecular chaperone